MSIMGYAPIYAQLTSGKGTSADSNHIAPQDSRVEVCPDCDRVLRELGYSSQLTPASFRKRCWLHQLIHEGACPLCIQEADYSPRFHAAPNADQRTLERLTATQGCTAHRAELASEEKRIERWERRLGNLDAWFAARRFSESIMSVAIEYDQARSLWSALRAATAPRQPGWNDPRLCSARRSLAQIAWSGTTAIDLHEVSFSIAPWAGYSFFPDSYERHRRAACARLGIDPVKGGMLA